MGHYIIYEIIKTILGIQPFNSHWKWLLLCGILNNVCEELGLI